VTLEYRVDGNLEATVGLAGPFPTTDPFSFTYPLGSHTVEATPRFVSSGRVLRCSLTVDEADTTDPTITCPPDIEEVERTPTPARWSRTTRRWSGTPATRI
jgi:hypothetical protein